MKYYNGTELWERYFENYKNKVSETKVSDACKYEIKK